MNPTKNLDKPKTMREEINKTVECMICHVHKGNLINHLRLIHEISCKDYKRIYNAPIISEEEIKRLRDRMNKIVDGVKYSKLVSDIGEDNRNEFLSDPKTKEILAKRIKEAGDKFRSDPNVIKKLSTAMKKMREEDSKTKRAIRRKCIKCGKMFGVEDLGWGWRSFSVKRFQNVYFCSKKCRNSAHKGKFGKEWGEYMKNIKIKENT